MEAIYLLCVFLSTIIIGVILKRHFNGDDTTICMATAFLMSTAFPITLPLVLMAWIISVIKNKLS